MTADAKGLKLAVRPFSFLRPNRAERVTIWRRTTCILLSIIITEWFAINIHCLDEEFFQISQTSTLSLSRNIISPQVKPWFLNFLYIDMFGFVLFCEEAFIPVLNGMHMHTPEDMLSLQVIRIILPFPWKSAMLSKTVFFQFFSASLFNWPWKQNFKREKVCVPVSFHL